MAVKPTITVDVDKVLAGIEAQSIKGRVKLTAEVGYTARYAVYVHEMTWVKHHIGKAKFLEDAVKKHRTTVNKIIAERLADKKSLRDALLRGAESLMKASKRMCPVDTGFLRDSAFFRIQGE